MHDLVTQEFLNLGVVLYLPKLARLEFRLAHGFGRISRTFEKIDGTRHRQLLQYLENELGQLQRALHHSLDLEEMRGLGNAGDLGKMLERVMPVDDSALQFVPGGAGLAADPEQAIEAVFERYVLQYAKTEQRPHKTDEDVWRGFREPLEKANLLGKLNRGGGAPTARMKTRASGG